MKHDFRTRVKLYSILEIAVSYSIPEWPGHEYHLGLYFLSTLSAAYFLVLDIKSGITCSILVLAPAVLTHSSNSNHVQPTNQSNT